MTAWIAYTDPLLVTIDQTIGISGTNWGDNRSVWHPRGDITLGNGGISGSVWYRDDGPRGMAEALSEPRAFCAKGNATIVFTGTTLIVRLNIAYSWFTGSTVLIDGALPSTLGLAGGADTLSCDSVTYGLYADGYIDVLVADGLADTSHTCVITTNSSDPGKVFSVAGYKVGGLIASPIVRDRAWLITPDWMLLQNKTVVTVTNRGAAAVLNVSLAFPAGLVDGSNAALTTLSSTSLAPGAYLSQTVLPAFTGAEVSGSFPQYLTLTGQYLDPAGVIAATTTSTVSPGSPAITVSGAWSTDSLGPGGAARQYTSTFGAYLEFDITGDALTISVQTALTWGVLGAYVGATLVGSVDCNVDSASLLSATITGFGSGAHTVRLKKTVSDSAFVVFVSASWSATLQYTEIVETVELDFVAAQPVAMPVVNAAITTTSGDTSLLFDPSVPGVLDYTSVPMRENTEVSYSEVMTRVPTFAVFYQTGHRAMLSGYDRLIVDPIGARAADVLYWQSLGIKVYGYISSGEETGVYSSRYDFTSALGPWKGAGPGGNAPWYMYTQAPTSPDVEGVFASYYINPDPAYGWLTRLLTYYAPQVLDGPLTITNEVVTVASTTITAGTVLVFDTAHAPLEADLPIVATTMDGLHSYAMYSDFTFDVKTGAVVLSASVSPAITAGQQLKVSYTRKGHRMDGVFLDTVDTPDVYLGSFPPFPVVSGYPAQFAAVINAFKAAYPSASFISNRGFTILDSIIASCDGVMFETGLTTPTDLTDLTTTDYVVITDPTAVAYNAAADAQLVALRELHPFDVYSLNYTHNDSSGDTLRAYCRAADAAKGYLSWQSIITLDAPLDNPVAFVRHGSTLPP